MVPVDSSAARRPRPGATMASATLFNSATFIALSRKKFTPHWSRILSATCDSLSPEGRGWGEGVRTPEQILGVRTPSSCPSPPWGEGTQLAVLHATCRHIGFHRLRFGGEFDFILCACGRGCLADQEHFHTRQGLAFERLQKGAAGGRNMGQAAHDARDIERRHGIA